MSQGNSEAFEAFIAEARRARGEGARWRRARRGDGDVSALFGSGEHEYAIAGAQIREVIPAQPITRLPGAPSHILGVVLHRRDVIGECSIWSDGLSARPKAAPWRPKASRA